MKKYITLGIVIGLVLALGIGWGASVVLAQGPTPQAPTQAQMQAMHESMHGAGSWDAMAKQMEQYFGQDWFSQMHGPNGMMNGMNAQNHMGSGGMMGGGGGMMHGPGGMGGMMGQGAGQALPTAAPDDHRPVDQTIMLVAESLRFLPARVAVQAGQTVRFTISNRDSFAHNFVSPQAGIGERMIPGGATQDVIWTAPTRTGIYRAQCTYHPGMVLDIEVE